MTDSTIDYGVMGQPGRLPIGSTVVGRQYARSPRVSSTEDAIAVVRDILGAIAPYPEKVHVVSPDEFSSVRLAPKDSGHFILSAAEVSKAHIIREAVISALNTLNTLPRMPQLYLVLSTGAVARLWDGKDILQADPCDQAKVTAILDRLGD